MAWLLNFFLELNIPITANYSEESGMHALWNFDTNHIARLKPEADHLKLWIPALTKYESFSFGRQRPIRWMHSFPHNVRRDQPTILLVRDGRDAVYSQFKRTREAKNLNVWLDRPIEPFALSPPYTWALFQSAWRNAVAPEHLLIVHFEELKQRPHETAEKILQFLQTRRAASLVDAAIAACSIERAQESEAAYRARREHTDEIATVHRKGAVQEWRTTYTPAALEKFTGFPQEVLHEFGYETPKT
ncbi:hypothetical protein COV82_00100, partial [Candidatus Peregrinibacteria bacterium CG11_big_fil_rev_8_21_14_0_20_46_8]